MKAFDGATIALTGPHLIEASAGTGKTYAITTLYLRLILERDLTVEEILVVTFTDAATAELKDRVRKRLREALDEVTRLEQGEDARDAVIAGFLGVGKLAEHRRRLTMALNGFDAAAIFTIHSFCMRMLRDSAFESGLPFDAELVTSQEEILERLVQDFWVDVRYRRSVLEVGFIDDKLKLSDLMRIASMAVENPDLPIIPEVDGVELDAQQLDAHEALYAKLREMWLAEEAEIRGLLEKAVERKILKGNSYRANWLTNWFGNLAQFLAPEQLPKPSLPDQFVKFTSQFIASALNKNKDAPKHAFFDLCETFQESHRGLMSDLTVLSEWLKVALARRVRELMPAEKETLNQLYFQDLLHYLDKALQKVDGPKLAATIRKRFPAAMIDEFQDTDAIQYRIFSLLFQGGKASLFLIGDPKQAIYAFRGADIFTYLKAREETAEQIYTMGVNWRSDPSLIQAVNALFMKHPRPFAFKGIDFPEVTARPNAKDMLTGGLQAAPLQWLFMPRPADEKPNKGWANDLIPGLVATRISDLLHSDVSIDGEPLKPGDIAVLVRKNRQADAIRQCLVRLGIPSVLHGNLSVFETREARELSLVLRAVAEPARTQLVKVALTTELLGVSATGLWDMDRDPLLWEDRVRDFRRWREIWQSRGFIQMFRQLMADTQIQGRLFATAEGERRVTNLLHLSELLQAAAMREHLGPTGVLAWLERQNQEGNLDDPDTEQRLETDALAVQLVTIHKSKGLEYKVVICPYLWEGGSSNRKDPAIIYHTPETGERVLDLRDEHAEADAICQQESFAEDLRLLYVALTRAVHRLEVFWAPVKSCGESALGYLLFGNGDGPGEGSLRNLENDMGKMQHRLRERVAANPKLWSLDMLDLEREGRPYRNPLEVCELSVRQFERRDTQSLRNSSFTGLTRHAHHSHLMPVQDYDSHVQIVRLPFLEAGEQEIALKEFPKGARSGIFFHAILEFMDFQRWQDGHLEMLVEQELRKGGFDASHWLEPISEAIRDVVRTPIDATGFSLSDLPTGDRLNEMAFLYPVGVGPNGSTGVLTPEQLAGIFEAFPDQLPEGYHDRVRNLDFVPLQGFLKGYIDLVYRRAGVYWLVDYKSNWIGDTYSEYVPENLAQNMAESHYILQYHLYALALHRHLRQRIADYDYETHFGGAQYLYIKGMSLAVGDACGTFAERPPFERIAALDALMQGLEAAHD